MCYERRYQQELLPLQLANLSRLLLREADSRPKLYIDGRPVHVRTEHPAVESLVEITERLDLPALLTCKVEEARAAIGVLLSEPGDVSAEDDATIRHGQALFRNSKPQLARMGIVHEKLQVLPAMGPAPQAVAAPAVAD